MPTSSIVEAVSLSLFISSKAWEKVVSFPSDPSQEDNYPENLIVVTMLAFRSADPDRKNTSFGPYCFPADGNNNVSLMTPLCLILEDDHLLVTVLRTS